jgi:hypothetical protein
MTRLHLTAVSHVEAALLLCFSPKPDPDAILSVPFADLDCLSDTELVSPSKEGAAI